MTSSNQRLQPQYEYYVERNLFPTNVSLDEVDALANYARSRRNLYERHLHIPIDLLRGQHVLELGCSTGEAATVLARAGALLTLVDADPRVWNPVDSLFAASRLTDQIVEKIGQSVDEFRATRRFALITAHGFLFMCPTREQILRHLVTSLEPGGLLSVSFPDELGSFMEFLKKAAFRRGCALRGISDLYCDEAVDTAHSILGSAYAQLPTRRPFRQWLEDSISSPFLELRFCWSGSSILRTAQQVGGLYYSSSPSLLEVDRLAWYKEVLDDAEWNRRAYENADRRAVDFMFGMPVRFSVPDDMNGFVRESRAYLETLSDWFTSTPSDFPRPTSSWFGLLESCDLQPLFVEGLQNFFAAFDESSWTGFRRELRKAEGILNLWGRSYHFLTIRGACEAG